jgi:hypothetical protein
MWARAFLCMLILAMSVAPSAADTVVLKDGRTMQGTITATDAEKITLDIDGISVDIPKAKVESIQMGTVAPDQGAPAQAPPPPAAVAEVPAGTPMKIRLGQSVSSRGHKGQQFTAKLEVALAVQGAVVAPAGTKVIGRLTDTQRTRVLAGKAEISMELPDLVIDGVSTPIVTETLDFESANKAKSTATKTAKGAAIGGLIDGSDGARTGAKVGLGASILRGRQDIQIPAGSILDFRLYQALRLQ